MKRFLNLFIYANFFLKTQVYFIVTESKKYAEFGKTETRLFVQHFSSSAKKTPPENVTSSS